MAAFFATSGDSWFWVAGLTLLWWFGDAGWRQWSAVQLLGILGLAALVLATKFAIRRQRPPGEWGGIYRNTDPHSFPSGHAARAFLIALLASALGPAWLAIILWAWAPLVTLARVVMGLHYLSDVVAGAVLGLAAAFAWLEIYQPLAARISTWLNFPLW